ncbi:MAG TPA: hypothetical protein VL098_04045 [Flavipsychrobacter sp.]|nr:hypothetical protein [Flavipsychrobacter sp.]
MYHIRVFRAIDDLEACEKFAYGHAKVLTDYGVTKVTSARTDWFDNPGVFVVLVQNEETKEVVGGERIHLVQPGYPLPIESAISVVEEGIYALVARYAKGAITGEICGLWNAKSIAGKGVSVLLTKIGVAIARKLGMDSLFVLCAPYTVKMCQDAGFEIETSIGNKGQFIYPKLDLIATSLIVRDLDHLAYADKDFRSEIFGYFENPVGECVEHGQKGETQISYDISIPNIRNEYGL